MKKEFILLFFLCAALSLQAQTEINRSIPLGAAQGLEMDFNYAAVSVSTWDRQEIQISGSVLINNGENDEAFQIETEKQGDKLLVRTRIKDMDKLPKFTTVKKDGKTYYFRGKLSHKEIARELGEGPYNMISHGIAQEIELKIKAPAGVRLAIQSTYGGLELDNCQSPLQVENTYGHIIAKFDQNLPADVQLHATYSFVDVSLPARTAADVDLNSSYGSIYTDHDLQIDKEKSKDKAFSSHIVGSLNRGGQKLSLKANYSNIYLRKI